MDQNEPRAGTISSTIRVFHYNAHCSAFDSNSVCVSTQVAYSLLLAAVPIGTILPLVGYQWSGAFYFLFLAVWTVYVGSHRRYI